MRRIEGGSSRRPRRNLVRAEAMPGRLLRQRLSGFHRTASSVIAQLPMPSRRLQLLLFALSFVTFAWFHQGGGWNQNARFAEVRALVEQGKFDIDDYMVYRPTTGRKLVREHVENAE